jgi:hypothetical protein
LFLKFGHCPDANQRAKARGWTVWTMEGDHNVHGSHPDELVQLLEKAPQ